eukprot:CAMPEP_0174363620 /NCGR_PEP_ID=MMETSP0811_2-20130205/69558_1 /TAXON_ID=73025 ORGANISM="Eutreptiella gymnastica-like, Strain CCMP1594" /NCGR_SAMPLE_ID=MMETSP0811_2 /ASSEMBLY_ACC=CAM_ASM_000667 /LENGTH=98 /DNA_ID=CAMNT_0015502471 /DNA_START=486 /DNA_END=782 /DNA_ORIENTATION=-
MLVLQLPSGPACLSKAGSVLGWWMAEVQAHGLCPSSFGELVLCPGFAAILPPGFRFILSMVWSLARSLCRFFPMLFSMLKSNGASAGKPSTAQSAIYV